MPLKVGHSAGTEPFWKGGEGGNAVTSPLITTGSGDSRPTSWLVISECSTGLANCLQRYRLISLFPSPSPSHCLAFRWSRPTQLSLKRYHPLMRRSVYKRKLKLKTVSRHSPINHILTRVPGKRHGESGGSSDELWKRYLEEIEKQDNKMIERWKGEADSTIIFVCAGPTTFSAPSV